MSRLRRTLIKPEESRIFQRMKEKDYSPLSWDKYFDERSSVETSTGEFRVYKSGTKGPLVVLLHGGGYSSLTWALFNKDLLSRVECRILAIDLRGHGDTKTDNEENLSIGTLTKDVVEVISSVSNDEDQLVVIGHSMGGAVATHCVGSLKNVVALCVIDVVEGTALESLSSMQNLLRNRPSTFKDVRSAIQWCYRTGQTQNLESAKVSMPGQIVNIKTGQLAATEYYSDMQLDANDAEHACGEGDTRDPNSIPEEDNEQDKSAPLPPPPPEGNYAWRINLSKTEMHWRGWFEGLSNTFLNSTVPKVLLMANIHGLDTVLTVGQMQGKFQVQVLPQCGHAIHEDLPHQVAEVIAAFLIRHRITEGQDALAVNFPSC